MLIRARKVIQIIFPVFILVVTSIYQISSIVRTKFEFDLIAWSGELS